MASIDPGYRFCALHSHERVQPWACTPKISFHATDRLISPLIHHRDVDGA